MEHVRNSSKVIVWWNIMLDCSLSKGAPSWVQWVQFTWICYRTLCSHGQLKLMAPFSNRMVNHTILVSFYALLWRTISWSMDQKGRADQLAPMESWLDTYGLLLLGVHQRLCVQWKGRTPSRLALDLCRVVSGAQWIPLNDSKTWQDYLLVFINTFLYQSSAQKFKIKSLEFFLRHSVIYFVIPVIFQVCLIAWKEKKDDNVRSDVLMVNVFRNMMLCNLVSYFLHRVSAWN